MGHGAARELAQGDAGGRELEPELVAMLDAALEKLDAKDEKFKAARDEERFAQRSKLWHKACGELDVHLRGVANVLIKTHQLNLDIGNEGGGLKSTPWIEEMAGVLPRLCFSLDGTTVVASCGGQALASASVQQANYAFVERAVVAWVVAIAEKKR